MQSSRSRGVLLLRVGQAPVSTILLNYHPATLPLDIIRNYGNRRVIAPEIQFNVFGVPNPRALIKLNRAVLVRIVLRGVSCGFVPALLGT